MATIIDLAADNSRVRKPALGRRTGRGQGAKGLMLAGSAGLRDSYGAGEMRAGEMRAGEVRAGEVRVVEVRAV